MPNFIKIGHIAILIPNLPKFLISDQDRQFQISYLKLTNLTYSDCQISKHWEYISFLWPNFPGMCYLAVILIFLVVTARYLVVTACYLVVTSGYCSLLVVTARYCSLLLVPSFSINEVIFLTSVFQVGNSRKIYQKRSISMRSNSSYTGQKLMK